MILFCNRCRCAYREADMFSESLCFSCHYKKEVNEEKKPAGQILTAAEGPGSSDNPGPDAKQGKLFDF
jgi:hypothetical protein